MNASRFGVSGFGWLLASIATTCTLTACGGPTAPSSGLIAPTLAAPLDDALAPQPAVLAVRNVSSTTAGVRTYDFQVADNPAGLVGSGTALLASVTGIAEGAGGRTAYNLHLVLQPAKRYYWRARAVQGGIVGSWSNTFRFRTDFAPNNAPIIQSLLASTDRAEVNTDVRLNAVVQDQETNPADLVYEWSATGGFFTGTGPTVLWRAPDGATPVTRDLTLTVIERYTVADPDGRQQARENRTSGSVKVHVNNSPVEVSGLALTFLDDFVHSDRSPEFCVRNFSDGCRGKQDELGDIRINRAEFINDPAASSFTIRSITYDTPGNVPTQATVATVLAPCHFAATRKSTGAQGIAHGTCQLTNVYEGWQWRLCTSHFLEPLDSFSARFIF